MTNETWTQSCRLLGFGILALGLVACSPSPPQVFPAAAQPQVTQASAQPVSPSVPATTEPIATQAAVASAPVLVQASAPPEPKRAVAPKRDECRNDGDCVVVTDDLEGATKCCGGCRQRAVNERWFAGFTQECSKHAPRTCLPIGCAMLRVHAVCYRDKCAIQEEIKNHP